jgi:hypothetical protein
MEIGNDDHDDDNRQKGTPVAREHKQIPQEEES